MKNKFKSLPSAFGIFFLLLIGFSCQDQTQEIKKKGPKITSTIVTDQRIIDEILSMVDDPSNPKGDISTGVALPPSLPPGYDYANMRQVIIEGQNWVTYVAINRSTETANFKDMIGIGYVNGVYKSYLKEKWTNSFNHPVHGQGVLIQNFVWSGSPTTHHDFYFKQVGQIAVPVPSQKGVGECGQETVDCVIGLYSGLGYFSLALTIASAYDPGLLLGAAMGCWLACVVS